MALGIDPTVDYAFKRILGNPDYPDVTVHFLNAVLGGSPLITAVEFTNSFLEKQAEDDKLAVLDILATDDHGRQVDIEMQTSWFGELPQRLTYYLASMYSCRLLEGDDYARLRPAICICVLDALMFPHSQHIHSEFRLRSPHGLEFTNHLQMHLLELPKYQPPSHNEIITDPLEQWCYFLNFAESSTPAELATRLPSPALGHAQGVLEMISRSPGEQFLYELRRKSMRDEKARLRHAEEAAREQGLKLGLEEGREQGELIGKLRILQEVLGLAVATDEEITSLNLDELRQQVEQLQQQLRERE